MQATTDFEIWLFEAEVEDANDYEYAIAALHNPGKKSGGFLAAPCGDQLYLSRDGYTCRLRLASERARTGFLRLLNYRSEHGF